MAHKKLLTEAEIRRFMKLATIGGVGDNKIQEYGMNMPGARDEEEEQPLAHLWHRRCRSRGRWCVGRECVGRFALPSP